MVLRAGGSIVGRGAISTRKERLGREWFQRIAPLALSFFNFPFVNLLEQCQQASTVMIVTFFLIVIFDIEFIAFETGGNAVGSGHHPLQEGVRLVVRGCGIDNRVWQVGICFDRDKGWAISPE